MEGFMNCVFTCIWFNWWKQCLGDFRSLTISTVVLISSSRSGSLQIYTSWKILIIWIWSVSFFEFRSYILSEIFMSIISAAIQFKKHQRKQFQLVKLNSENLETLFSHGFTTSQTETTWGNYSDLSGISSKITVVI